MSLNKNTLNILLVKCIAFTLLLYIISTPIMYMIITNHIYKNWDSGWSLIGVEILRLAFVIIIGICIQKKNDNILLNNIKQRKIYAVVVFIIIGISIVLDALDISPKICGNIANTIGIYEQTTHLFISVLYEQLFSSYLMPNMLVSMLICFAIVLFGTFRK